MTKIRLSRHLSLPNGIELNAGEQYIESLLAAQLRGMDGVSYPDEEHAVAAGDAAPAIAAPPAAAFDFAACRSGAAAIADHKRLVAFMQQAAPAPEPTPVTESVAPTVPPEAVPARRRNLPTVMDTDDNNNHDAGIAPEEAIK